MTSALNSLQKQTNEFQEKAGVKLLDSESEIEILQSVPKKEAGLSSTHLHRWRLTTHGGWGRPVAWRTFCVPLSIGSSSLVCEAIPLEDALNSLLHAVER